MGQSHLPLAKGAAHVKAFERAGWTCATSLAKDKHYVLSKPGHQHKLSIPKHREVKRALLQAQIRLAGMTDQEYVEYFNRKR